LANSRPRRGVFRPISSTPGCSTTGSRCAGCSEFYANAAEAGGVDFDVLFGPAYKGIPLVAAIAVALARRGRNLPFAYNRKEAKDHGEGGSIVGAPLAGRVLIVDDVISAGTSVRESVDLIRGAGAIPAGVLIALDRQERGQGELSAAQEVRRDHGIPVIAVAGLRDLLAYLEYHPEFSTHKTAVTRYREQYGVSQ
jgi:orotate phosphoribosyltransferase